MTSGVDFLTHTVHAIMCTKHGCLLRDEFNNLMLFIYTKKYSFISHYE